MTYSDDDDKVISQGPVAPVAPPRFLLAAVYIMGGVLVVLFVLLVVGIFWKATNRSVPVPEGPKLIGAGLPAGAQVDSMALDGDRLAIRSGNEIVVVDLRKGAVTARVRLNEP
jgi:hypothetical protein